METIGLDNGFKIRGITRKDIPSFVKLPFDFDGDDGSVEIAYYRKCWGIRSMILGVLHARQDEFDFKIDYEDLNVIVSKMSRFFDKEYWENEGDSIWTYEEAFEYTLLQQTINLKWLLNYWETHPKLEVIFYDSY